MSRIKPIGSSLKAFSARMRRIPLSYRTAAGGLLLTVLLLNSLLTPGCKRVELYVGVPGGLCVDDFCLKEIEMENVRFEPQGLSPSIQPAHAYWIKRGDMIAPRWDTHEFHWERNGAMCDFLDNASTGDCLVCDFCVFSPPSGEPLCNANITFPGLAGTLEVAAAHGFIPTDSPQQVLTFGSEAAVKGACSNNTTQFSLPSFEPAMSGVYRLRSAAAGVIFKGETNGSIKLHVVEKGAGLAQKAAYQLMDQAVDNTNYWTWTIEGSPLWLENFSPNLRVTDIRIFKGACADGSAQGKQCAIPDESAWVKPSRVIFYPSFPGTLGNLQNTQCFSNPVATGGNFINLASCCPTFGAICSGDQIATPTILFTRPMEKLTWLVEFNINQGADADLTTPGNDPMPAGAQLIIEFTIEAP